MNVIVGFLAGLLFGIVLIIAGMTDPAKVINFLDIFGAWDPSLAFVLGGATLTTFVGYRLVLGRPKPALASSFDLPATQTIDRQLIIGAGLFGIGWGIGGFCPGPAWAALALAHPGTLVFLPSMLVGFWLGTQGKTIRLFQTA